jgi:hypothetical protein
MKNSLNILWLFLFIFNYKGREVETKDARTIIDVKKDEMLSGTEPKIDKCKDIDYSYQNPCL